MLFGSRVARSLGASSPLTTSSCVTASPPRLGPSSSRLLVPHLPGDSLSASFAGFVLLTAYIRLGLFSSPLTSGALEGGSTERPGEPTWPLAVCQDRLQGRPRFPRTGPSRAPSGSLLQNRFRAAFDLRVPRGERLGTSALSTRCPWVFPVPRKNEVRCLGDSDSLSRRWGLGRCVSTHFLLILVHTAQDVKAEKHRLSNLFMGSFTHGQS